MNFSTPVRLVVACLLAGTVAPLAARYQNTLPTEVPASLPVNYRGWDTYGGDAGAHRYSALTQLTPANVARLQVAWTYRTGDSTKRSQMQCNPIVVGNRLFATSPQINVFALDAATGKEIWRTNLSAFWKGETAWAGTNRGVTYWTDGTQERILCAAGNYLFSLDARTGQPDRTFGTDGRVDLQRDLDYDKDKFFIVANTPGIVYKDLIVLGMRLTEGLDAAPGHVRAYSVRTGRRAWIFHTIPHPGEPGYETWADSAAYRRVGGANCWAGMALDRGRGIVYVPTGSASYDFYGSNRLGANLYANCLLALDAATGRKLWHHQFVHHDLWDTDLPANPNLVTVTKDGRTIDAVAQITKQGTVFVFDRVTGQPVFPIHETPVRASDLPGERAWPTQPTAALPVPFMRQTFTAADIIDLTPAHHAEIAPRFAALRSGGTFLPPSERGNVHFPGFDGGGEWGGASVDPTTGWLYVNANEMPWVLKMKATETAPGAGLLARGQNLYVANCANCHATDRRGNHGAFPNLTQLNVKYQPAQVADILRKGRGAMPAYAYLPDADRRALVAYLLNLPDDKANPLAASLPPTTAQPAAKEPATADALTTPYVLMGYERFLTTDGYPAIKPPWGTLNALDLNTGQLVWQKPLGEYAELTKKGVPVTGTENYGGPVNTAGGLVFIAATKDEKFRAFDKRTGKVLFETKLPAGGYATPCVYEAGGRQVVVIACGGGKMGTPAGDTYVAFALPQ